MYQLRYQAGQLSEQSDDGDPQHMLEHSESGSVE
jgi:hypothetical protein